MRDALPEAIELENEYAANKKELARLQDRNREITEILIGMYHNGIKKGDIVTYKGDTYLVSSVGNRSWSISDRSYKPWVMGYLKKKDGSWGKSERYLYSEWEKP
jgi:hypothetical protein